MRIIQKYKYIVAEDELLIRNNIIKKINSLDLPLIFSGAAANGLDAMQLMKDQLPHIVFTDINMPQSDGLEVAEFIFKNHPDTKVVLLSGYSEFSYAQKALRCGVSDYLLKPLKIETLRNTIQGILFHFESTNREFISRYTMPNEMSTEEICDLMVQFLQKNYTSDISLQALASEFGFTYEYLSKLFKKFVGQSPLKYLTQLRMNQAKQLLLQFPDLEIGKIGEYVGYQDAFYFSRAFKNYAGVTPSEYRISHI